LKTSALRLRELIHSPGSKNHVCTTSSKENSSGSANTRGCSRDQYLKMLENNGASCQNFRAKLNSLTSLALKAKGSLVRTLSRPRVRNKLTAQ
jgi:hypothetical protein